MINYLELTEDQMVEELSSIQILARGLFNAGRTKPYNKKVHEKASVELIKKMNKLAIKGYVI